ncbi:hypothetical protein RFI_01143 [Reticulomyxa filosa]|uniref:Uncharacterized protein n=1 Tax=Reticulomyxa filosa TaxID=46433 RepID=X6PCZ5_RETFI|nr:hypothetical protein RFI_01143 [Reticulomyxa filosa]|eukprot:ETO35919.1 hypothetical protein RFI_01143 [Reticulomyxa filosa]
MSNVHENENKIISENLEMSFALGNAEEKDEGQCLGVLVMTSYSQYCLEVEFNPLHLKKIDESWKSNFEKVAIGNILSCLLINQKIKNLIYCLRAAQQLCLVVFFKKGNNNSVFSLSLFFLHRPLIIGKYDIHAAFERYVEHHKISPKDAGMLKVWCEEQGIRDIRYSDANKYFQLSMKQEKKGTRAFVLTLLIVFLASALFICKRKMKLLFVYLKYRNKSKEKGAEKQYALLYKVLIFEPRKKKSAYKITLIISQLVKQNNLKI